MERILIIFFFHLFLVSVGFFLHYPSFCLLFFLSIFLLWNNFFLYKVLFISVFHRRNIESSLSALSESTRLYDPVRSGPANEISFDKKSANQIVSFNTCLGKKKIILCIHLLIEQAFCRPNWSIIENISPKKDYFFWNGINLAQNCICIISLLVQGSMMPSSIHHQPANKAGFHGASCQLPSFITIWTHSVHIND